MGYCISHFLELDLLPAVSWESERITEMGSERVSVLVRAIQLLHVVSQPP